MGKVNSGWVDTDYYVCLVEKSDTAIQGGTINSSCPGSAVLYYKCNVYVPITGTAPGVYIWHAGSPSYGFTPSSGSVSGDDYYFDGSVLGLAPGKSRTEGYYGMDGQPSGAQGGPGDVQVGDPEDPHGQIQSYDSSSDSTSSGFGNENTGEFDGGAGFGTSNTGEFGGSADDSGSSGSDSSAGFGNENTGEV